MTGCTSGRSDGSMIECCAKEGRVIGGISSSVAGTTIRRCRYVKSWLAQCRSAIMAGRTSSRANRSMSKCGAEECRVTGGIRSSVAGATIR